MIVCPTEESAMEAARTVAANPDFNEFEAQLAQLHQIECKVTHLFTPGLYVREIVMPKGAVVTSKIHLTEHPFVISMGLIRVWTPGDGVVLLGAPYMGVTKPGTRRILLALEDTVWATFHATRETDVAKIEQEIIFRHDVGNLTGGVPCLGQQ